MKVPPEFRVLETRSEGEFIFPLRSLLQAVRRRLLVIVLVAISFVGTAVLWSLLQDPTYESSVLVLVGQGSGFSKDPVYAQSLQDLTPTMARAVDTLPVAREVAERTDPRMSSGEVLAGLSAQPSPETQFIEISFSSSDPEVARKVANAVGEVFSEQIADTGNGSITANVWEAAETPTTPVSPRPTYNAFAALVLGVFVGLGLAFLLEYLDDSWRSSEEAERISGVPNLAMVPKFAVSGSGKKQR
jgi:capsular polysaccharide biosynthesis protein